MLNLEGVECSFAIVRMEDVTFISGRSWGKINVQVILEKLGGGGHLTVAGAQLEQAPQDAKEMLLNALETYFSEQSK